MKKELSEQIADGIMKGFWKPILIVVITMLITYVLILIVFSWIPSYIEYKICEPNERLSIDFSSGPIFECRQVAPMQAPSMCPTKTLDCAIYLKEDVTKKGTEKSKIFAFHHNLCGWQEANAWLEYYETFTQRKDWFMECEE